MKNSNSKFFFIALTGVLLAGCATKPSSSQSSFEYSSLESSAPHGYVFDSTKYTLNPLVGETIASFEEIVDAHEIPVLKEVIGLNDFYANKITVTSTEKNLYDFGENGNTLDEGNFIETSTKTIVRNDISSVLSGSGAYEYKDHEREVSTTGVYSMTYDEGFYVANETWDFDNNDYDETNSYTLNDEFVYDHLVFIDAEEFLDEMIEASLDDETIFDAKEISTAVGEDVIALDLNRTTFTDNIRHDQRYRMVITLSGYVSEISYSYIQYFGKTTAAPILRESTFSANYEKVN